MTDLTNNIFRYRINVFRILSCLIVYGIFGVFTFLYFRSYLALLFLIVLAFLTLSSIFALVIISKKIKFSIFVSDEFVSKGENIGIGVLLQNPSIFSSLKCICEMDFCNKYLGVENKCNMLLAISPLSKKVYNYTFDTSEIGDIEVKINTLEIYDLFGIVKTVFEVNDSSEICILPQKYSIDDEVKAGAMNNLYENDNENVKGFESSDSFDIRNYIPGDRIKDIHWKLSVKKDDLLVKERLRISDSKIVIWIDSSSSRKIRENILSLAYGLIEDFSSEGIVSNVYWYDYNTNNISFYNINSSDDIKTLFKNVYSSGFGECIEHPESLLLSQGFNSKSIIRIGTKEYEANIFTYDF